MDDSVDEIDPTEAAARQGAGAVLLDVREEDEWRAGHAPGALHVPLSELPDRLDELVGEHEVLCICRSGGRSARAAAFLAESGQRAVNVAGGMAAWAARGLPLEGDGHPHVI